MTQTDGRNIVMLVALLASGSLTPTSVIAADAQVYRCGDTYSQTPCGDNATQPKLYGARGAVETSALEKAKSCAAAVAQQQTQQQQPEDGLDWQLLDASEAKPELINVSGTQVLGFRLSLTMAQTTAQGQRLQRRQFSCAVSQDFQRVLSLQALP